ncbi:MAG: hypothetical protein K8T10_13005 [Candidatus Eremiobacteraeota bacterium]|nr:hypothetical protein [Candidatus Eremiobacteraeota bacterium]
MLFNIKRRNKALLPRNINRHQKARKSTKSRYKYFVRWIYPAVMVVVVVFFLVLFLCENAKITKLQYNIGCLKVQKKEIQKKIHITKLNIEKLQSLERIDRIARNEIKMIEPAHRLLLNLIHPTKTAEFQEETDSVESP